MQPPRVFFRGIETIYLWCCVTTLPTAADSVSRLAELRGTSDATASSFLSRHRNDISVVLCYNSADSCRQRVSPRGTSQVDA